jgi:hypothetical protein
VASVNAATGAVCAPRRTTRERLWQGIFGWYSTKLGADLPSQRLSAWPNLKRTSTAWPAEALRNMFRSAGPRRRRPLGSNVERLLEGAVFSRGYGRNGSWSNRRKSDLDDSKLTFKMSGMEAAARFMEVSATSGRSSHQENRVANGRFQGTADIAR